MLAELSERPMNFQWTSEQALLRKTVRNLAQKEFGPAAFQWDGVYPAANEKILREQGLYGVSLPQEYGGGGLSLVEEVMVLEEVGKVCQDTAIALTLLGPPRIIAELGSEQLCRKYLPPFCEEGRKIGIAISESEAGSAVTELRTKATTSGSKVVVDGEKVFISHAEICSAFLTFVRFEEGIGAVIVDKDAPGLEIGKPDINMAGHCQYNLLFTACEIPEENIVIRGKGGFEKLIRSFNSERCLSAMWAVSIAESALDRALVYAQQRKQFGRKLAEFQGLQWMLAEMAMQTEAARLLTYQAAANPTRLNSSMAKAMASEMAERVTSDALQIFGGTGYMKKHPLEYLYRLARGRKIGAGTVEIQKNMIARELLQNGLHRED